MKTLTLLRFVIGLLSLANWIIRRIDRAEWVKLGKEEAAKQYLKQYNDTVAQASEAKAIVAKMTEAEKDDVLGSKI